MAAINPYKDRRQVAAGGIAVTVLVASGWLSASQSFVSLRDDRIVHPSPWQWPLFACLFFLVVFVYGWLSTYFPKMIPRRYHLVDPRVQYSICVESFVFQFTDVGAPLSCAGQVFLTLRNLGELVIDVEPDYFNVKIMGNSPTPAAPGFYFRLRVPPGQTRELRSGLVTGLPVNTVITGEISYSFTYGAPTDSAKYRYTHENGLQTKHPVTYPTLDNFTANWEMTSVDDVRIHDA